MTHGALFNGIGGFQLAASWCGWQNVFSVEIDKWCNKVTAQHFPECKQYEDIYNFNGKEYAGRIDVISGGFPCQPFSVAGKRKGKEDDRYLWPEMLRVISEVQPTWVVGENVGGIVGVVLDEVLTSLEGIGYEAQPIIIPACAKNAPHRRDRVWIVAHSKSTKGWKLEAAKEWTNTQTLRIQNSYDSRVSNSDASYTNSERLQGQQLEGGGERQRPNDQQRERCSGAWGQDWTQVATALCRVDDGLPRQLDRAKRLKALGNAIVPQVVYEIFKAIGDNQ